jgi:uncharacterized membrane protein YgdD (TMEM256/DUF423 family)
MKGNSMSSQFWVFIAALFGGSAVVAGAIGAHSLPDAIDGTLQQAFRAAQQNHLIHAAALLGIAVLMRQSEGYRSEFSSWAMQAAAAAFTLGIILFSGGIYAHVMGGLAPATKFVPVGGAFLIGGWTALALAALGLRY